MGKPRSSVPGPACGRPSAATLRLRPPPVSLSLPAAEPGPSARPAGPLCPAPARATPAGVGGRSPALPSPRSGAVVKGTPGALGPSASGAGSFLCPLPASWGSRSRKVRSEIPSQLFKGLAAAARVFFFFFFSSAYTPWSLRVSSYSFPFPVFDCLTACVFVSSLCSNCSFTLRPVFVSVSRGCFCRKGGWCWV